MTRLGGVVALTVALSGLLAGCGIETASTAATAAALKAEEAGQAKRTVADVRGRLDSAQQQASDRVE